MTPDRYIVFTLLFALSACNNPQKQQRDFNFNAGEITAVNALLDKQVSAWNSGDIDGFMKGYWHSDSLRFISKRGIRYGYDSVSASYKRHYNSPEKMGRLNFSGLTYTSLASDPPLLNVCGKWNISGSDSAGGFFSLILRKTDTWAIIADHTW